MLKKGFYQIRYWLYMKSATWDARKRLYYANHPHVCAWRNCKKHDVDLHHLTYVRMGKEKDTDLVPLCKEHHRRVHKLGKLFNR